MRNDMNLKVLFIASICFRLGSSFCVAQLSSYPPHISIMNPKTDDYIEFPKLKRNVREDKTISCSIFRNRYKECFVSQINYYNRKGQVIQEESCDYYSGLVSQTTYEYDSSGKIRKVKWDNPLKRKFDGKCETQYDGRGNVIREMYFGVAGDFQFERIFKFDDRRNITEEIWKSFGKRTYKVTAEFDLNNNMIAIKWYDTADNITDSKKYDYNIANAETAEYSYNRDGLLDGDYYIKTYDANGKMMEKRKYSKSNTLVYSWAYEYDQRGRKIMERVCPNDSLLELKKFDDFGNMIEEYEYERDGGLTYKTTRRYDTLNNLINEVTVVFQNGKQKERINKGKWSYKYDLYGNVIEKTSYKYEDNKYQVSDIEIHDILYY